MANFYQILRWVVILSWGTCLERTICKDRGFASFLCVLSLLSVIGSFKHMYCETGSLGKCIPAWGVKPLFFRIPNIFAVNKLLKTGKIRSVIAFYKLFLSHIKVKILINSWHFLMVFSDVLSLWLTPSVFNKWKALRWFKFSNVFVPLETVTLSCFWVVFWPELPKICQFFLNFWPVMTCKMMQQICYSFYCSIKKWSKLGQKADF